MSCRLIHALRAIRLCGAVAEWSKALAWKVSIRHNRIEGSNPSRSATPTSSNVQLYRHCLALMIAMDATNRRFSAFASEGTENAVVTCSG
jgi:hypothetical protein